MTKKRATRMSRIKKGLMLTPYEGDYWRGKTEVLGFTTRKGTKLVRLRHPGGRITLSLPESVSKHYRFA